MRATPFAYRVSAHSLIPDATSKDWFETARYPSAAKAFSAATFAASGQTAFAQGSQPGVL